jgi:hypothetical protein
VTEAERTITTPDTPDDPDRRDAAEASQDAPEAAGAPARRRPTLRTPRPGPLAGGGSPS